MKNTLEEKLANLPSAPGVYFMKDAKGRILYVGLWCQSLNCELLALIHNSSFDTNHILNQPNGKLFTYLPTSLFLPWVTLLFENRN